MSVEKEIKSRTSNIRIRTWTLTLCLVVCLIFYYLVSVIRKEEINWIDFTFVAVIQIIAFSIYFPEGDLFGTKDSVFINNRKAYNEKALSINSKHLFSKLREYCKYEFEEKKKRYIENWCSIIGITKEEFEELSKMTEEEFKNLSKLEFNGRYIYFNQRKKKLLYNLIFKVLPVKPNQPETIMSAIENNGFDAIHNEATGYRRKSYTLMILKATLVGLFLAYIGYTMRDGITFAQIVSITMCLTALLSTAIIGFSKGEKCSKVYQSAFYMQLANYIDGFFEWCGCPENVVENNLTN